MIYFNFCPKHRLWLLISTISTSLNTNFSYINWGFPENSLHGHVNMMDVGASPRPMRKPFNLLQVDCSFLTYAMIKAVFNCTYIGDSQCS